MQSIKMIIDSRAARVKAMKITSYLFIIFVVASVYGGDGANLLNTLQNLSLPEKIILPAIPLMVPIVATTYDYFKRHYEPKTENELNSMLDNLRQAKKKLVEISSIGDQDESIKKFIAMGSHYNFGQVRSVDTQILHIDDIIERMEKTEIKGEKDLYRFQYFCRTFSDQNCLFNVIQNAIENIETRIFNKQHLQDFKFTGRLNFVYFKSGRKKIILLTRARD